MVDNLYEGFIDVIFEGCGMLKLEVKKIVDGCVYDGWQVKKLNFVDEFGFYDDIILVMKKDYKDLKNVFVIFYEESFGLGLLFFMGVNKMFKSEIDFLNMREIFL